MGENLQSDMTEMLVLHVVAPGATFGFDIAEQVLQRSQGHFSFKEGELYPVLHHLERRDFLHSYWTQLDEKRRRKFYSITAEGSRHLEALRARWDQYAVGVEGVLGTPQWAGNPDFARG